MKPGIALTSKSIVDRLQTQFCRAIAGAKFKKRCIFLELYAGKKVVTRAIKRLGFACLAFEIDDGLEFNLINPIVHRLILGWLSSGCIAGVFLGTQCSSWSRARRGPIGTAWGPLRSLAHIAGLPGLAPGCQKKVDIGNQQVKFTAHIIRSCIRYNIPCMLENPLTSMMWAAPSISRGMRAPSCEAYSLDQCQYGTRWKKATQVFSWCCGHANNLSRSCAGKRGICSKTGLPHIQLTGVSKTHKVLWTKVAQTYPRSLGHAIASKLISSAVTSSLLGSALL